MKITVLYRLTIRYEIMAMTCYQLQVIYTRVLFSSRSQVSKSWRSNVYLYVHVCIYVAIGEKNRETILLSLQACFVIAHSSRDYMRVCVCVCVCVHVQSSSTPAVIEAKFVIDQDTQLVPAVSGSMELRVYRFPYVCIASFQWQTCISFLIRSGSLCCH